MSLELRLAAAFLETHPMDAAPLLERLDPAETAAALGEVPASVAARVLRHLAPAAATECLHRLAPPVAAAMVAALPLDDAALLVRRLPDEAARAIREALSPTVAEPLTALLQHPEHTAGSIMDPRVLAVPDDLTVEEALARVRRAPRHVLYYLYVVDRVGHLDGVLNLRELMLAPADAPLAATMRPATARLSTGDSLRAVAVHPGWRSLHAMPVVDGAGKLAGAIRYETVRRLADDSQRAATPGSGLGTLLGVAELCWVAMTGILVSLVGAERGREPGAPGRRSG